MNLLVSSAIMENIISGLVGAIIAFFGSILLIKFNYKDLFAKTVSQDRIVWLKQMREYAENLFCFIKEHNDLISDEDKNNYFKLKTQILLRLNVEKCNNKDKKTAEQEIFELLSDGEYSDIKDNLEAQNEKDLIFLFRTMLKDEWEKVKCEARGYDSIFSKKTKYNKVFLTAFIIKSVIIIIGIIYFGMILDVYFVKYISLDYVKCFTRVFYLIIAGAFIANETVKTFILTRKKYIKKPNDGRNKIKDKKNKANQN